MRRSHRMTWHSWNRNWISLATSGGLWFDFVHRGHGEAWRTFAMQGINDKRFGRMIGGGIFLARQGKGPIAGVIVVLVAGVKLLVLGLLLGIAQLIVQLAQVEVSRHIFGIELEGFLVLLDGQFLELLALLFAGRPDFLL